MENAVICSGVTKSFGEGDTKVQVLRKLDLEIGMGQLAMLMGPSGCGKTTLLSELGLGDRLNARPSQLSGGQQQRVAIARALIHDPRLILCDEPTSALDAQAGEKVMELLCTLAVRPERAVIVVTHDTRIVDFANTIAHMEDGRVTHIERGSGLRVANEALV